MTKNYTKPIVTIDSGMAEGVSAASGCYTASAYIHQTPENGRGDYRIQVNGKHNADHTKEAQVLTISFNRMLLMFLAAQDLFPVTKPLH